jgi:ATP phosphoribosyltransferase
LAKSLKLSKAQQAILDKLLFRINAVLRAKNSKYILLNVPNEKIKQVSKLLPVLKSPTILPLADEGWSSLHTVIDETKFWEVIDELKAAGAEDILIVPIDKMVI